MDSRFDKKSGFSSLFPRFECSKVIFDFSRVWKTTEPCLIRPKVQFGIVKEQFLTPKKFVFSQKRLVKNSTASIILEPFSKCLRDVLISKKPKPSIRFDSRRKRHASKNWTDNWNVFKQLQIRHSLSLKSCQLSIEIFFLLSYNFFMKHFSELKVDRWMIKWQGCEALITDWNGFQCGLHKI